MNSLASLASFTTLTREERLYYKNYFQTIVDDKYSSRYVYPNITKTNLNINYRSQHSNQKREDVEYIMIRYDSDEDDDFDNIIKIEKEAEHTCKNKFIYRLSKMIYKYNYDSALYIDQSLHDYSKHKQYFRERIYDELIQMTRRHRK
jgi:hypothetical protein